MYEFEGELYWKAQHTEDDRVDVMGRIKLFEFCQNDDEISTELFCEKATEWAEGVKRFMRNEMPAILQARARKLVDVMKERDMDEQRLAAAQEEEKRAAEEYKKMHELTAEKKAEIAAQAKLKEEEMRVKELAKQA